LTNANQLAQKTIVNGKNASTMWEKVAAAISVKNVKKQVRRLQKSRASLKESAVENASNGLDLNMPVQDLEKKHKDKRVELSKTTKGIQETYDKAKVNNNLAN